VEHAGTLMVFFSVNRISFIKNSKTMALRLRVRTPDNAMLQITELNGTSTLGELQQLLATKSKISANQQERTYDDQC
jgi:hypothetical protein